MRVPKLRTVAFLSTLLALKANAAQPWDSPFAPDTAALRKAANQANVADDPPVHILLEEQRFVVENDGRVRGTFRRVYEVLREDAVEDWSSIEEQYQPWRDRRPVIRARVISKGGTVHSLDPKTIADSPAAEFDASTFSDQRVVRAPLPAVAAGSLIEYEISTDDSPAFVEAGVARRIKILDNVPLERFHFEITAPKSMGLQTASQQIPPDAIHRSTDKQTSRLEFELGPFTPRKTVEYDLPFDLSPWPYFGFTTAHTWQAIAAKYADLIEKQIQAADLKSLMDSLDLTGDPVTVVARLASQLHRNIRYTGIEFGESAIIPARPAEVLQRRFGDCKDKSALLVAMLRAAGLKANVALLRSGFEADVDTNLPGIDLFDHAIVFVDIPNHPLWVDATASDLRIGDLPYADQGRLALVASHETTGLVRIPEQNDAWERHVYEVRFRDFGPGSITEIIEAHGPQEGLFRTVYASGDNPKTALEKYVKTSYSAKSLGTYDVSGGDDLNQPLRVSVEARETPQVVTNAEFAQIILGLERVFFRLPFALRDQTEDTTSPAGKTTPRTHDFILPTPEAMVHIYKLFPPSQYKIGNLPASAKDMLGPLTFSRDYKLGSDGEVDVEYRLDVPKRRISAEEYEKIREGVRKIETRPAETINFVPVTAELLAVGEFGKAVSVVREDVEKHSSDATAHIRLSRLLVTLGLGHAARAEARKAVELDKDSSQAWQALAWSLQNDTFGRLRQRDWDRTEALKALRRAVELDPDDAIATADLAILLEYNNDGERYGKGADLPGAIEIYRDLMKKRAFPALEPNLTASLFYSGQYDAARDESTKCAEAQRILFSAAVLAMQQGVPKAVVSLQSSVVDPSQRTQLLALTALLLAHVRRYEDANVMMQAAQRVTSNPQLAAMAQMLARAKRTEDAMLPPSDPRSPVQAILVLAMQGDFDTAKMKSLLSSRGSLSGFSEGDTREVRGALGSVLRQLNSVGLTSENLADITLAQLNLEKHGDDARGYKIEQSSGVPFPLRWTPSVGQNFARP